MDSKIFYFINKNLSNPFFDFIMPFFSYIGWGGIIWIVISFYLIFFDKKEGKTTGILSLIGLILSAILSEVILKNIFCRMRPYEVLKNVNLLVMKEKSFSFPSGHAVSSFTSAIILGYGKKIKFYIFLLLAILISFSRIYCGVHYPSDVLSGTFLGIFLGSSLIFLYRMRKR